MNRDIEYVKSGSGIWEHSRYTVGWIVMRESFAGCEKFVLRFVMFCINQNAKYQKLQCIYPDSKKICVSIIGYTVFFFIFFIIAYISFNLFFSNSLPNKRQTVSRLIQAMFTVNSLYQLRKPELTLPITRTLLHPAASPRHDNPCTSLS